MHIIAFYAALLVVGTDAFRAVWTHHKAASRFASRLLGSTQDNAILPPSDSLVFAGVKFQRPISTSLRSMGIQTPSPIQQASLVALATGLSCILHAETGSGKTLAYLLPILRRIYSSSAANAEPESASGPIQAMIVVPTKELAVQVAADVASLVSAGATVSERHTRAVHLCLSSSKTGLDGVTAPIVVGTPFKLVDAVLASSPETLASLSYLVLDEVDRLVNALGKYSTSQDRRASRDNEKPVEELLSILVKLGGILGDGEAGGEGSGGPGGAGGIGRMQVVAASATVGRALRRELFRLLQGGGGRSGSKENAGLQGELPVVRPGDGDGIGSSGSSGSSQGAASSIASSSIGKKRSSTGGEDSEAPEEGDKNKGYTRRVGIPRAITHRCVLMQDESNEISTKLAAAKKLWTAAPLTPASNPGTLRRTTKLAAARQPQRGLLFVPQATDLQQVLGMLSFWGIKEATNLQRALGIESLRPVGRYLGKKRYKLPGQGAAAHAGGSVGEGRGLGDEGDDGEWVGEAAADGPKKMSSAEMVMLAASNKIGSAARSGAGAGETPASAGTSSAGEPRARELFVVPVSGTRGLHIQDVEVIYVLQPPRSMDEYLHMAGRCGRQGNTVPGTVVSLVNHDELLRLQSWETPLGITFEVEYEQ